jgi:NDP-sugar pyrophosphorylase family protein
MTVVSSLEAPQGVWGIVLAGAFARAGSSLEKLRPRPLLPVANDPVVAYPLRWLAHDAVDGVSVCLNRETREVRSALSGRAGMPGRLEFLDDHAPRGSAGSARDAALSTGARTFIVVSGTTLPTADVGLILAAHESSGAAVTVVVHEDSAAGSEESLSPSDIYVFDRRAFHHVGEDGYQDIKETLVPKLYAVGERVVAHTAPRAFGRLFDTEAYLALNDMLVSSAVDARVPEGYRRVGEALIHETAWVSPRARLLGPMVVGARATVEDAATLVGPVAIGSGSYVAHRAVVSRSVLWEGCLVEPGSEIDRCLLADGATVIAGTRLYRTLKKGRRSGQTTRGTRERPMAHRPATLRMSGALLSAVTERVRTA